MPTVEKHGECRLCLQQDSYFKAVDLGRKHSERLRLAILSEETLPEAEFPILLAAPLIDGQFLSDWILPPDPIRVDGNRLYRGLISGYLFSFIVGSAPISDPMN